MPRGGARKGAGRPPKNPPEFAQIAPEQEVKQAGAKLGAPSPYKDEFAVQAEKLCALGATDIELADFFNVAVKTIWRWAHRHEAFGQALKTGKSAADERVQASLYHRAVGYSHPAVKIMAVKGEIHKVEYTEHVAPDTTACIFWLKNRRKDQWRDRHEHEHGGVGEFDRMTDDELRDFIARGAQEAGIGLTRAAPAGRAKKANGSGRPH